MKEELLNTIIINGIATGILLQLAIGPVFIFIANTVIQKSLLNGFASIIAVTVVDYIYILLAIIGVGKILENNRIKKIFGIASSIVLIIFGLVIIINIIFYDKINSNAIVETQSLIESFIAAFILTISSPLTIVFWTGLFGAKAIELDLNKSKLFVFGLSAGFSTVIFLGISAIIISRLKNYIPYMIINYLNLLAGTILILYGVFRILKISRTAYNSA